MDQAANNLAARQRTLYIIWGALLISIGCYLVFANFFMQRATGRSNWIFSFAFACVATFIVILSFPIRQKVLRQAVDKQQPALVQQGFIVAWAMTEVSAILGLVEYAVVGTLDYIVLFILAIVGMLLHFPSPKHLQNASYKTF